jgi:DNA-binding HxlR family transcriptional regulator
MPELQTEICATPNLLVTGCPSRQALDLIGDKWAVIALYAIGSGIDRHGRLSREIEGVTKKMLTQTLRNLERCGLITRDVFDELPPRVEYRITELGASLLSVVQNMCDWAVKHMPQVEQAQGEFDARSESATPWIRTVS